MSWPILIQTLGIGVVIGALGMRWYIQRYPLTLLQSAAQLATRSNRK